MKLIRKLFIASVILSIGSITGVSVWANSNNFSTLSSSYMFYWFVTLTSFLFSLGAYFSHSMKSIVDYTKQNIKLLNLHMYIVTFFGTIYIIFWLGASAGVTSDLRYCIYIKNNLRYNYYFNFDYTCYGEVISTFFGFCNFILWCIIVYYSGSYWYSNYKKSTNNNIELEQNNESLNLNYIIDTVPETKQEELPPILETKQEELLSVPENVTEELPSVPENVTEELPSVPIIDQETFTQQVMETYLSEK